MIARKDNALKIALLLSVAAVVCLGVGLRLLALSGGEMPPLGNDSETHLVAALSIIGGVVIFLLGTIALLAARRFARTPARTTAADMPDLDLMEIQTWGQELADIRDHLRRDLASVEGDPALEVHELVLPSSWQPEGQYLIDKGGQSSDPLADLKRTRDQLLEAAERVDAIVQSINDLASGTTESPISGKNTAKSSFWCRWRKHR